MRTDGTREGDKMAESRSNVEQVLDILKRASGPMTIQEIIGEMEHLETSDPKSSVRSAITNLQLVVANGRGAYEYVPRATEGAVLRHRLSNEEIENSQIIWSPEIKHVVWPGLYEVVESRRDCRKIPFYFDAQAVMIGPPPPYTKDSFLVDREETLTNWLKSNTPEEGDELLIKIEGSGPTRCVHVTFSPQSHRCEEEIRTRNEAVSDELMDIVKRRSDKSVLISACIHSLAVRGVFSHSCPPDPLEDIVAADERLGMSDIKIGSAAVMPPSRAELTKAEDFRKKLFFGEEGNATFPFAEKTSTSVRGDSGDHGEPPPVYQIIVTLGDISPPIWREVHVPSDIPLDVFHDILQVVMGWEDVHLYAFHVGPSHLVELTDGRWGAPDEPDARGIALDQVLSREYDTIKYVYDFGDDWRHEVKLKEITTPDPNTAYPTCIRGERACPPENCGGPPGYIRLLESLKDRNDPEHEFCRGIMGDDFDPEAFDAATVNSQLNRLM